MAKTGLSFFRSDTDKYQDIRIKRLKKSYKGTGIAVYDYILTEIYRVKGYYINWDAESLFDVADYFDEPENLVKEIVSFCCEIGLFDNKISSHHGTLTSGAIQSRYLEMCAKAKRNDVKLREELRIVREEVAKIREELPKLREESPKIQEEMAKTPEVSSETMEETRIVKNSIVKNSIEDDRKGGREKNTVDYYKNFYAGMARDQVWVETTLKTFSINAKQLREHLRIFFLMTQGDRKEWSSQADCNRHFRAWLMKQPIKQIEVPDKEVYKLAEKDMDAFYDSLMSKANRAGKPLDPEYEIEGEVEHE